MATKKQEQSNETPEKTIEAPEEKENKRVEPTNIHEAINAVMRDVGYVQKQKGEKLDYTYASETALIQAVRPLMVKYGIYIHCHKIEDLRLETYETKHGTSMNRTVAKFIFRFVHAPSGTKIKVPAGGEGADVGDKSLNKAMTGAMKYALRQTFLLETGDDPDESNSEGQERIVRQNGNRIPPKRPFTAETVKKSLNEALKEYDDQQNKDKLDIDAVNALVNQLHTVFDDTDSMMAFVEAVTGKSELNDLTKAWAKVLWNWSRETAYAKAESADVLASIDNPFTPELELVKNGNSAKKDGDKSTPEQVKEAIEDTTEKLKS